jgi:hypothetical protein
MSIHQRQAAVGWCSHIEGPGLYQGIVSPTYDGVFVPTILTIHARDIYGNKKFTGGDTWCASAHINVPREALGFKV